MPKKTPLQIVADVAVGKVDGVPSHWTSKPTLHACPNCKRAAGSVCVPRKWRPWGKPCAARVRLAARYAREYRESIGVRTLEDYLDDLKARMRPVRFGEVVS